MGGRVQVQNVCSGSDIMRGGREGRKHFLSAGIDRQNACAQQAKGQTMK